MIKGATNHGCNVDHLQRPIQMRPCSRHDYPSRSRFIHIAATTRAVALIDRRQKLLEVNSVQVDSSNVLAPRIREVGRQQANPIGRINLSTRRS